MVYIRIRMVHLRQEATLRQHLNADILLERLPVQMEVYIHMDVQIDSLRPGLLMTRSKSLRN